MFRDARSATMLRLLTAQARPTDARCIRTCMFERQNSWETTAVGIELFGWLSNNVRAISG
eukprot:292660-Alexandrium_andersonii.AAC.1